MLNHYGPTETTVGATAFEVTAESALRGARASAELEGAGIELERLRGQLLAGGTVTLPSKDERGARVVEGAVRLHADLGSVLASWRHSPRQGLHVLAASELVPTEGLGRPRAVGASYDDPLELGPAPDPLEVAARLDGLSRVLTAPTTAPAVVVAAVVHGELLALRPFGTLDGVVARAAARLVLVERGLDPKAVSAPEVGHSELHHEYADAARMDGCGEWGVLLRVIVPMARPGIAAAAWFETDA